MVNYSDYSKYTGRVKKLIFVDVLLTKYPAQNMSRIGPRSQ